MRNRLKRIRDGAVIWLAILAMLGFFVAMVAAEAAIKAAAWRWVWS